ncbi:MAG: UDP-N-acetylmuramate--L-alanine ligase [Lachnospiraceae bacterium]|nr:UDP-N-acetylmuramate--L-alanine ligase [Candidatus Minthocola equi]
MYEIDFNHPIWVHFIGIGGISMSGLAEVLLGKGFRVTGSDIVASDLTKRLTDRGAEIFIGHRSENLSPDVDLVVFTAAVHPDNPEYIAAESYGIPLLNRADMLGELMRNYPSSVAVAGTHGKTTTTSMVSEIMLAADLDPTVSVGGMLDSIGGNIRVGASPYFVCEACEFTNSYLSLSPLVSIILNVANDHLDFFGNLENIRKSFRQFAEKLTPEGTLIICSNIDNFEFFTEGLPCHVLTVGRRKEDDYRFSDEVYDAIGHPTLTLHEKSTGAEVKLELNVPGEHNIWKAICAIAAGRTLGIPMETAIYALEHFDSPHRRFELVGYLGTIPVIDDYGHHPDEVAACIKCARNTSAKRIVAVFQAHTYSRVKLLLDDFTRALSLADIAVIGEIYSDREKDNLGMSAAVMAEELRKVGTDAYSFPSFGEIEQFLLETLKDGDILLTIGSKEVWMIGYDLLGLR